MATSLATLLMVILIIRLSTHLLSLRFKFLLNVILVINLINFNRLFSVTFMTLFYFKFHVFYMLVGEQTVNNILMQ